MILIFLCCAGAGLTGLAAHGNFQGSAVLERGVSLLSQINSSWTDFKFFLRGQRPASSKIVILEIDDPSIEEFGRWPWHRDQIAKLIESSFQAGAKVVGLDFVLSEPDVRVPPDLRVFLKNKNWNFSDQEFETDYVLAQTIKKYQDHLVLGWASSALCSPKETPNPEDCPVENPEALATHPVGFGRFAITDVLGLKDFSPTKTPIETAVTLIPNLDLFASQARHSGFFNSIVESDGVIRKSSLVVMVNKKVFPSLALKMVEVFTGGKLHAEFDRHSNLKSLSVLDASSTAGRIPVDPTGKVGMNFRGPQQSFTAVSAFDFLTPDTRLQDPVWGKLSGQSKNEIFKDAIVLIGISALGVGDRRAFPFDANVAGVEGHATLIDNLLNHETLRSYLRLKEWMLVFIAMFLGGVSLTFVAQRFEFLTTLIFYVALSGVTLAVDLQLFSRLNLDAPLVFAQIEFGLLFLFTSGFKYFEVEKNRNFIRGAFSRFVSPEVVAELIAHPDKLTLGGEKKDLTILFSDIREFTACAERLDAKDLTAFLNRYLAEMTNLVFENHGTLDKYIGDAVMAFWGAPVENPRHPLDACRTAFQMQNAVEKLRPEFLRLWGVDLRIGIGFCSGVVNVGNMGSEKNFEYTVIGDKVNLAARLESLTKIYGVPILTTRETVLQMKSMQNDPVFCRRIDQVRVKGKSEPTEIYEVSAKPFDPEGLRLYDVAYDLYLQRNWIEAELHFAKAAQVSGEKNGPCERFQARCQEYSENPVPKSWDGIWDLK